MSRKRSRVADWLVYLLVRALVCIVQTLSWSKALTLARAFAWLMYRVDRRHRLVAADNIRHAFADLDESAVDRLVRASYLHLTTMLVEMIRLPRVLRHDNVEEFVHPGNPGDQVLLHAWNASDRPRMALTGHFGNWEVLSYAAGMCGFHGGIVARRLDNPYLDRFLAHFRRRTGQALLDKNRDYGRILTLLEQGDGVGMVGDQDAGPRGLFVDFFGRPASTFKSIALLSLQYQAGIFVLGAARVGWPMRYRVYLEDLILPEDYASHPDAARAITQRYTHALERLIRRHPEQYFWLHRRWKHQPKSKGAKNKQMAN
jgi:KDO2-lipid IV(A) lauroyltransferase